MIRFACLTLLVFTIAWGPSSASAADGVDESPLPIRAVRAFPNLKPRRPVAITHAGDGTNRIFILSEHGQILVGPNDPKLSELKTFLDIEFKVDYQDNENEEGLLGLAFHPKYKENGEFFVYYTIKDPPHTSIIRASRSRRIRTRPIRTRKKC
jgi:quinoprotein glucose dehydrogenase